MLCAFWNRLNRLEYELNFTLHESFQLCIYNHTDVRTSGNSVHHRDPHRWVAIDTVTEISSDFSQPRIDDCDVPVCTVATLNAFTRPQKCIVLGENTVCRLRLRSTFEQCTHRHTDRQTCIYAHRGYVSDELWTMCVA